MLARVKQDYAAGPVMAFSGREYVRNEWREVPAGFEEQAKKHPLLDTQPGLEEIRAHGPTAPGLQVPAAVTVETEEATPEPTHAPARSAGETEEPAAEDTEPKTTRRRKRAGTEGG